MKHAALLTQLAGLAAALPTFLHAQTIHVELEPNGTKAEALANGPFILAAGDSISGFSTGSAATGSGPPPNPETADYFLIQTMPAPPGIYRHRLILTSAEPGHTATLRGLDQLPAPPGAWTGTVGGVGTPGTSDIPAQVARLESPGEARLSQWYGFGREERIFYRIDGTEHTTEEYLATLETQPVMPTEIGTFAAGQIIISTFGQAHNTDTDLWIYDSNLEPIPGYGNDGASTHAKAPATTIGRSYLRRQFEAGTYYIAITNHNLASSKCSPSDDSGHSGTILDFPDSALASSAAPDLDLSFSMTDANGSTPVAAHKQNPFEIVWLRFTVTGSVGMGACCFEDGTCDMLTEFDCVSEDGTWHGDGVTCAAANCPQPGGCCFADGSCDVLTESACQALEGSFAGPGISCASAACPQPGACCLPDQTCQITIAEQCDLAGGNYLGAQSLCSECPAAPTGACCLLDETCEILSRVDCNAAAGAYLGDDTTCEQACPIMIAYEGSSVAIPDPLGSGCGWPTGVEVEVTVPNRLVEVDAALRIAHPWQGDLRVVLTHVDSGRSAVLVDRPGVPQSQFGFAAANFGTPEILFRLHPHAQHRYGPPDVAAPGLADVAGTWRPHESLEVFAGLRAAGVWRLDVQDCAAGYTGSIRAFVLSLLLEPDCYANCDQSTTEPLLTVDDFTCFINAYAEAMSLPHEAQVNHYANCDGSTSEPVLTVDDFTCFINSFAEGCL